MLPSYKDVSLSDVHESVDTTVKRKGFRRFLAYVGPAYLVSVGYMDPGNWATDLQGGARFGYSLIWVLLMSNLMALLLQSLSARLGIVRRKDLAQANREVYPPMVNFCLYILAELAIAATDLAEVLGMAIGIHLLTGIPILWGVLITVLDTFILLILQRYGIRKMEAFIIALVAVIGLSFLIQLVMAKPDLGEVAKGFVPSALNKQSLYIAVGIIGATVMPHNLYLHSALVQTRKIRNTHAGITRALRYNFADSAIALNAAFLVNAGILILAASVFYTSGNTGVARIEDAHKMLEPMLGNTWAPILFAVALIAAGQSSTVTGTLAGQIVMEGYLRLRINPWIRRLLTRLIAIIPAVLVIVIYGDDKLDDLLVLSQVVLSLQLGFAIIPLIHFVSDKQDMGHFAIKLPVKILAWLVAGVLVFLNARLVIDEMLQVFEEGGHIGLKIILAVAIVLFGWLFLAMTFLPLRRRRERKNVYMHKETPLLQNLSVTPLMHIAIALDFSGKDENVIAQALRQGNHAATYILIHIVETVTASYSGDSADDNETRKDEQHLASFAAQLTALGYTVETALGYRNRVSEIVRIVQERKADMLVMGSHRHTGLKDIIYGETANQVRHKLMIPVLIV
ncbi:Nramp family divalent metal transporter [Danxiaibacter flavus]|uniref:Divalent metal cation transporter MntH n=1 Tax=Danxiaibacter flavus TaxID=3049108 RepID=A0ABV3ZFJ0_9BACT|nr:Nramp family divalent metal transporter [Chitinophagaceae bacterium DXS]